MIWFGQRQETDSSADGRGVGGQRVWRGDERYAPCSPHGAPRFARIRRDVPPDPARGRARCVHRPFRDNRRATPTAKIPPNPMAVTGLPRGRLAGCGYRSIDEIPGPGKALANRLRCGGLRPRRPRRRPAKNFLPRAARGLTGQVAVPFTAPVLAFRRLHGGRPRLTELAMQPNWTN